MAVKSFIAEKRIYNGRVWLPEELGFPGMSRKLRISGMSTETEEEPNSIWNYILLHQGREWHESIYVPEEYREHAGIEKEVVILFLPLSDRIEMWGKEEFDKYRNSFDICELLSKSGFNRKSLYSTWDRL